MAFGGAGRAGVGNERHEIAEVASVADSALDALLGHDPGDHQRAHTEIAQYKVDIGRDKDVARRLAKNHLVFSRGDGVQHLPVPRPLRHVDAGNPVIEAAVAAVLGHVLDDRIQNLDLRLAAAGLQPAQIWHYRLLKTSQEMQRGLVLAPPTALGMGAIILHIDDQQRRVRRIDRRLARRDRHCRSKAACAAGNKRANRSAQAACPAGSVIRSWRISISTWGSPRRSPCTGTV